MSAVAYFIGGPLDLTKREIVKTAEIMRVVGAETDYVYAAEPVYIRGQDTRQHFVFVYQGEIRRA